MRGLMLTATLMAIGLATVVENAERMDAAGAQLVLLVPDTEGDLPCPWCYAPTAENDAECPSCHQQFG